MCLNVSALHVSNWKRLINNIHKDIEYTSWKLSDLNQQKVWVIRSITNFLFQRRAMKKFVGPNINRAKVCVNNSLKAIVFSSKRNGTWKVHVRKWRLVKLQLTKGRQPNSEPAQTEWLSNSYSTLRLAQVVAYWTKQWHLTGIFGSFILVFRVINNF